MITPHCFKEKENFIPYLRRPKVLKTIYSACFVELALDCQNDLTSHHENMI